jgi:hypothetical protein
MTTIVHPSYFTALPSTGEKVKFRPFTVKEEKNLLLALQENDVNVIVDSIKSTITACTSGQVDPDKIPYYDSEFLFLQIRAKSVGEVLDLIGSCDCGPTVKTPFSADIESTVVTPKPTGNKRISIPQSGYVVEFRHPSIEDFAEIIKTNGEAASDVVANCVVQVFTDDEIIEMDTKGKIEFVESMSPLQQKELVSYLKNMPMTQIPTQYRCVGCGKEHKSRLSGFENFFV